MNRQALWTSAEIASATNGKEVGTFGAHGVSIDSRSVGPGDLFVAIKGPNFDGNDFAAEAIGKGAAGALVSRPLPADMAHVLVQDTEQALNAMAAASRQRSRARFLAVTGSVGKTSTKEMLRHALSAYGESFASSGNLNNQWGAPLSLARMPRQAAFGIFELGMNHAGEIAPLSRLVRPEVAVITWVAAVHLEFFASVEEIAEAKAEILLGLQPDGTAVLPGDNEHFALLARRARENNARIVTFGQGDEATCRLISCVSDARGSEILAEIDGLRRAFRLAFIGRHQAMNSLAALAAVAALGLDVEKAIAALAAIEPLAGRGKRESVRLPAGDFELIDESYNASPASMRAALSVLATVPTGEGGRKIAVLGDMRELGEEAPKLHRDLVLDLMRSGADMAFLVGPHMRQLYEALPANFAKIHREESLAMAQPLSVAVRAGDVVLVKGSLGTRMKPLVEALRALAGAGFGLRVGNGH